MPPDAVPELALPERSQAVAWLLARARAAGPAPERWAWLEAAHVLGQPVWRLHARSHAAMATQAWADGDARELLGQGLRWVLTLPAHLLQRLPAGNSGRARLSPFAPMAVSDDLQRRIRNAVHATRAW